jgi:hypothetical protein
MSIQENTVSTVSSWKDWFNTRDSSETINKSHQERLFKIFNSSVSNEKCRNEIEGHLETTFLFRQSFGSNRINIFHHMTVVGGNLYIEKEEFGFIQGVEESATCFMTPDYETLLQVPQETAIAIPTTSHLLAVSSIQEVEGLVTGQTTSYKPRNFIPIPPFLLEPISKSIKTSDGDSKQVLISVASAIKEFDTLKATDNSYNDKAKSKCKDILAWLYLVGTDKVSKIPTMGCNSRSVIDVLKKIEETSIISTQRIQQDNEQSSNENLERIFKRPLEILATSSSSTQDYIQKLAQFQNQANDKASKSFKKIAPKYQKMLLIAASQGEVIPTELNKEAMEFFNQNSVLNAQIFLNSHLESERIECSVSTALTTSLMHGSFLWSSSLTPSGLASSVISSLDIIRFDTLQEGIILDYSTKHEMSASSLAKLTKTQVLFPQDIDSSIERLRALESLVRLFFGKISIAQQGLTRFVNLCIDNKQLLRTRQFLDEMFISKLHFTVDDRLNQWLKQCCRANDVLETNMLLVDFSSIFYDVQLNKFHCYLPPNIKKVEKAKDNNEEEDSNVSRRKKKSKTKQTEQIRNESQVPEWKLRLDENWDTVFKNKTRDGPLLSNNCKPCLKYQVKGICYSDCPFVQSHKKLSGDDICKTSKFIKELRGE